MKTRKVGVIGIGHVGAHVAYSLAIQGIADEIVLVDQNSQKAVSECQDLTDSIAYMPHRVRFYVGDFADLKECDVVVNSVGKIGILAGTHDRLDEMNFTISAVNGFVDKVMASGFGGVVVNITNPCDIVTRQFARLSGMPRGRVFGTGTGLDTSRLLSVLARQTGFDHKSITGYMMGEHGASQMVPWSQIAFGGKRIGEFSPDDPRMRFDREAARKEVIGAGWVTFQGKQCTEYGICSTCARLVQIVLRDEKRVMPVSAELAGEYGQRDLFVGVPAVVGKNGVEEVIELNLPEEELSAFCACCDDVRRNMAHVDDIR